MIWLHYHLKSSWRKKMIAPKGKNEWSWISHSYLILKFELYNSSFLALFTMIKNVNWRYRHPHKRKCRIIKHFRHWSNHKMFSGIWTFLFEKELQMIRIHFLSYSKEYVTYGYISCCLWKENENFFCYVIMPPVVRSKYMGFCI